MYLSDLDEGHEAVGNYCITAT